MKSTTAIAAAAALSMLLAASPAFALAQIGTSVSGSADAGGSATGSAINVGASASVQTRLTNGKSRADEEITRRIDILNALSAQVEQMIKVSDQEKSDISTDVSTEVSELQSLQTKIDAEVDLTTLKSDIKSIATDYRIFLLVIPRGRIDVASDKIGTVGSSLSAFAAKLQTRLSAGDGTSADATALADMNAKIADASAQSSAAVSEVASLQPDNGDANIEASNSAAIKDARAKVKAAMDDLKTARQDAGVIVKDIEGSKASLNASADASTSVE